MTKVKNLPSDINLTKVKVKLPKSVLSAYKNYAGGEEEMWIAGSMMGDFFLSPDAPGSLGKRRLYPMPESINPQNILEWKVVKNINE